jgi:hypothetical protein
VIVTPKLLAVALACGLAVGVVAAGRALTRRAARDTADSTPAGHGAHHGATPAAVDWTRVSDRDLDIAELFVIARKTGVGPALNKLEALAASDTVLRDMGHVIAHGLGRFVVAQGKGNPAVYADCREVFQAGCNHGVMEAYFASARAAGPDAVTPHALDLLCARITRAGAARLVSLECAHGMGHGLVARYHGDVRQALGACDHLMQADARRECHDGVFMENAVRATTSADIRVGDAAVQAGATAHEQKPLVRRGELTFPCDEIAEPYHGACWRYQPIIMLEATRGDQGAIIEACEHAPEAFRNDCYFGIGKQGSGWWEDQDRVAQLCERVPAVRGAACIAGAVESYLDEMWTVERAMAFCGVVGKTGKQGCYEAVGARLAIMRNDYLVIERECARAEDGFVPACVKGVALVWLRR